MTEREITPFRIDVPGSELDALRSALARTRWPDQLEGAGWEYGTNREYLQEFARYWADGFDWRAQESALNELPNVTTTVDGLRVHAVHQQGGGPDPLPLVLTHGWPSSFYEWHKVIGPLSDPASFGGDPRDAFHVVAPSMPGYGFSEIPRTPGVGARRIAAMWVTLMQRLGYDRFGAHGCDWGSLVTALLGLDHADHLVGIHQGSMLNLDRPWEPLETDEQRAYAERLHRWGRDEGGYGVIQSTRPQTLGYALHDSPVGLAAWIVEKWRRWADCDGDLDRAAFTRDQLLTNISIYWFTGTINSANRLYYEIRRDPPIRPEGVRVRPPAGFLFERAVEGPNYSLGPPALSRAERIYDVRRWTIAEHGGHFPALETPELFVDEVRAFFRDLRPALTSGR